MAAARALARQAGQRELAEQPKFLADTGRRQPAKLEYVQPELVHWRTDAGQRHGKLSDIATFYAGLRCGRSRIYGAVATWLIRAETPVRHRPPGASNGNDRIQIEPSVRGSGWARTSISPGCVTVSG